MPDRLIWLPATCSRLPRIKVFARGAPKEWFAVARTSKAGNSQCLQGFHASDIRVSDDGRSIIETLERHDARTDHVRDRRGRWRLR